MKRTKRMKRYTVEPGRHIYLDGKPFISIGREGETIPADADSVTHAVADALNKSRVRRGKYGIRKWST